MLRSMIAAALAFAVLASVGTTAEARRRPAGCPYTEYHSAAGQVCLNPEVATAMLGFIADVVDRGFTGRVNCYAARGHVRGSFHYTGSACDFAQRGWNKTHRVMYRVRDLAAKWGLRDGCTFRDCGHVDSGPAVKRSDQRHRRAHR